MAVLLFRNEVMGFHGAGFRPPWGLCCLARPPLIPCPCFALPTHQLPSHPSRLSSSAAPSAELPQTSGAGLLTPSSRLRVLCLCWCFFHTGWTVFPSLSLFLDPVSHLETEILSWGPGTLASFIVGTR